MREHAVVGDVRTQSIGWEYDDRTSSLGEQVIAEAVSGYGDGGNWIELLGFDGTSIDIIDELAVCEFSCDLVADLGPTGAQLVYTQRRPYVSGQIDSEFVMTAVDHRSGSEQMRTDFSLPDSTRVISLDTVDGRTVAVTGSQMVPDAATHPVLRRGDRGPWVSSSSSCRSCTCPDGPTPTSHRTAYSDRVPKPQSAPSRPVQASTRTGSSARQPGANWSPPPGRSNSSTTLSWSKPTDRPADSRC